MPLSLFSNCLGGLSPVLYALKRKVLKKPTPESLSLGSREHSSFSERGEGRKLRLKPRTGSFGIDNPCNCSVEGPEWSLPEDASVFHVSMQTMKYKRKQTQSGPSCELRLVGTILRGDSTKALLGRDTDQIVGPQTQPGKEGWDKNQFSPR